MNEFKMNELQKEVSDIDTMVRSLTQHYLEMRIELNGIQARIGDIEKTMSVCEEIRNDECGHAVPTFEDVLKNMTSTAEWIAKGDPEKQMEKMDDKEREKCLVMMFHIADCVLGEYYKMVSMEGMDWLRR